MMSIADIPGLLMTLSAAILAEDKDSRTDGDNEERICKWALAVLMRDKYEDDRVLGFGKEISRFRTEVLMEPPGTTSAGLSGHGVSVTAAAIESLVTLLHAVRRHTCGVYEEHRDHVNTTLNSISAYMLQFSDPGPYVWTGSQSGFADPTRNNQMIRHAICWSRGVWHLLTSADGTEKNAGLEHVKHIAEAILLNERAVTYALEKEDKRAITTAEVLWLLKTVQTLGLFEDTQERVKKLYDFAVDQLYRRLDADHRILCAVLENKKLGSISRPTVFYTMWFLTLCPWVLTGCGKDDPLLNMGQLLMDGLQGWIDPVGKANIRLCLDGFPDLGTTGWLAHLLRLKGDDEGAQRCLKWVAEWAGRPGQPEYEKDTYGFTAGMAIRALFSKSYKAIYLPRGLLQP